MTESDNEFREEPPSKKPVHKPKGRAKQKTVVKKVSSGSEEEAMELVSKKAVPKPKGKVASKRPQN